MHPVISKSFMSSEAGAIRSEQPRVHFDDSPDPASPAGSSPRRQTLSTHIRTVSLFIDDHGGTQPNGDKLPVCASPSPRGASIYKRQHSWLRKLGMSSILKADAADENGSDSEGNHANGATVAPADKDNEASAAAVSAAIIALAARSDAVTIAPQQESSMAASKSSMPGTMPYTPPGDQHEAAARQLRGDHDYATRFMAELFQCGRSRDPLANAHATSRGECCI